MNNVNNAILDNVIFSSYTLANFKRLQQEAEIPPEAKPRLLGLDRRENVSEYTTLFPAAGLVVSVRITEDIPSITQDKITAAGGMLPVDFANFRARTWRTDRGEIRMSVKADKVIPTTSVPTKS